MASNLLEASEFRDLASTYTWSGVLPSYVFQATLTFNISLLIAFLQKSDPESFFN
jgi:hypothetical protein